MSSFTANLDFVKTLLEQTTKKYGLTSEKDEENQTAFKALSESDKTLVSSILDNIYNVVIDVKDEVEHEYGLNRNDYDCAIAKYKLKGKTIISAIEKFKPTPAKKEDWDCMNPNYSWLSLTKEEIREVNTQFLISIAPENACHQTIKNFVTAIYKKMRTCFYHNFSHVTTVMQVSTLTNYINRDQLWAY